MAVDICSPRISFSHDLKEPHVLPMEHHNQSPDSSFLDSIDFDFSIDHTSSQDHLSSADELFKNGKMLPFKLKETIPLPRKQTHSSKEPKHQTEQNSRHLEKIPDEITQKQSLKELLSLNPDEDQEEEEKKQPSLYTKIPFWQFRRSTSLNLESCRNSTLIRSLNFLSRSNSTGSVPNPKTSGAVPKEIKKQNSEKERRIKHTSSNQYYSFSGYRSNSSSAKNYGNGVRISPILNIPQGCISRGSVSLFGLSSFFCNSKSKKKKSQ